MFLIIHKSDEHGNAVLLHCSYHGQPEANDFFEAAHHPEYRSRSDVFVVHADEINKV